MLSSMPASENISFEKIVIFQPHNFTWLCTSSASCGITLISCIHKKNTKTYCSVGVGWIFPVCMELNHWRNQICLYLPLTLLLSMYGLIYSAHELDCLVSPSGDACAERQIWLYSFLTEISRSWRRGLDHFCERAPGSQHRRLQGAAGGLDSKTSTSASKEQRREGLTPENWWFTAASNNISFVHPFSSCSGASSRVFFEAECFKDHLCSSLTYIRLNFKRSCSHILPQEGVVYSLLWLEFVTWT